MPAVARVTDPVAPPDKSIDGPGISTVTVEGLVISVIDDKTVDGPHDDSSGEPGVFKSGSPSVTAGGKAILRVGDQDNDPGEEAITGGAATVTADAGLAAVGLTPQGTFANTPENQYISGPVEPDGADVTPQAAAATQGKVDAGIQSGVLTSKTVPAEQPPSGPVDSTVPAPTTGSSALCSVFDTYTNTEYPVGDPIYSSLMLTPATSLATFTTKTALWAGGDPKWLKCQTIVDSHGNQYNLTMPEILCCMANLAKNCWEPIKAKYPNAIITNVYRQGSNNRQHGTGQAMDIQFKGVAPSDYLGIAQWIRDNIQGYNQLLLEKASNAPWVHISYYNGTGINVPAPSRVGTLVVGPHTTFVVGLQQVA